MSRPIQREPLPVFLANRVSRAYHDSLAQLCGGQGSPDHLTTLARLVYVAFLMECIETRTRPDPEPFRAADVVLSRCWERAQGGHGWTLDEHEAALVAPVLALHDTQIASYAAQHFTDAWNRLTSAVAGQISPLADGDAQPGHSMLFARLVKMHAPPCAHA
ncbi:hypothetical protein [Paraburkholderia adhaesiva]|uniref:hypothetical protein n=1 Tax=Paraburkholderia adhaesiva TaxID=2883244 RepID=UPI001F238D76|nr:hypothetical protein [Paraburkholderia adhaesiva]